MLKTKEELFEKAQEVAMGCMSDLAACSEGEPLEGINVAEFTIDRLYDQIEFEVTTDMIEELGKKFDYYV